MKLLKILQIINFSSLGVFLHRFEITKNNFVIKCNQFWPFITNCAIVSPQTLYLKVIVKYGSRPLNDQTPKPLPKARVFQPSA